jgi:glutathione S-transferase
MLTLYHYPFSTCSQKVRLVLAEKHLDFTSREVDILGGAQHDPEYVALNPNHVVPTLVDDGVVLIESTLINEYLDDAFPEPPLRPSAPAGRHALRLWTKLLDEKVHPATAVVTFAIGPRMILLQQPEETREANLAAIPDPKARAARRSVIEHGVRAPEFAGALGQMIDLLDRMEAGLARAAWLSGESYGLADAAALPYVLRLEHSGMSPLLAAAARPRLADWYARARARPSFATAVTQWAPEEAVAFLRAMGDAAWPEVEPIAMAAGKQ